MLTAAASVLSEVKSFQNSYSKSSQSMKWRLLFVDFDSSSNSHSAQRPAHPLFMYDIAQIILVSLSSNTSGHRQVYIWQDVKNAFLLARLQLKSEGVAGLRKFIFQPAEGADEGEGW